MLTKAGHDVTLIDQWPDHVEAMKKIGLRLSGTCGEHLIPVGALHISELQSVAEPFTPFNDTGVELIVRVPPGTLKSDPRNLEPLVAMLPK